jgi:TonB-linked SusC/RagA family outer membrane protein
MKSDVHNSTKPNSFSKKVVFLLGMLFMCVSFTLTAQNTFTYSGVVQNEKGEPLPGATVMVKGTTVGTATDLDGKFTVNYTQPSATFLFSMVGLITIEKEIKAGSMELIVLKETITNLNELVVVGYGIQKKSNITGAISTIGSKQLLQIPTNNVNEALQGRISGVNIVNTSGSPGAGQKVSIRGVATNGSVQPLYVVDGFPTDNIDNLDPNDIDNLTVLKDAASAAIYGAEAANGVILITTRSGVKGTEGVATTGGKIDYSFQGGFQSVGDYAKPMDATSWATWINEANVGVTAPLNTGVNTNWMDEILHTAFVQRHHLAFSGANSKGNYYISGSYVNQDGVIGEDKSNFERYSFRSNLNQQVKPWIQVSGNVSYTHWRRNAISEDDEFGGLVASALSMDPTTPTVYTDGLPGFAQDALAAGQTLVQNADGQYYGLSDLVRGEIANPLAQIAIAHGKTNQNKLVGNGQAVFGDESWGGFKVTTRASVDFAHQLYNTWTPSYWFSSERLNTSASYRENTDTWYNWVTEAFASYDKTFGKHSLSAVAGISSKQETHKFLKTLSGPMFAEDENFAQHGDAEIDGKVSGNLSDIRTSSFFGRASYEYASKYLVSATMRRDGTSLLHPDKRWGSFPSLSAGWIISREDFWKVSFIDFMKVRGSWGTNGNLSGLGPDQFRSLIISSGIQIPKPGGGFYSGAEPELLANPELTWATSEQIDLGIDMTLFGDKLSFGFDYFNKKTKDLLVPGTPPLSVGNKAPFVNAGDITNKGMEIELGYRNYESPVKVDFSTNLTFLSNEVTYLNPLLDRVSGASIGTGWTATYLELGYPIWYFRGYETAGIFQNQAEIDAYKAANGGLAGYNPAPGDPIVVNTNGDELINNEDQTKIGDPHPNFMWGANLSFNYKAYDFRMIVQGVHGNDVLIGWNRADRATSNRPQFFFDERWTGEGSTNERPRADQGNPYIYNSDLMVYDGSFIKIRQIQLGYTIPKRLMKSFAQNLRVYISLDDYFTFTSYPGMDASAGTGRDNSQGIDRGYYPAPKKIMFGLSCTL